MLILLLKIFWVVTQDFKQHYDHGGSLQLPNVNLVSTCFHHITVGCLDDVSESENSVLPSPVSFRAHNCMYNPTELKPY
jgi:hypothetical protein